MSSPASRRRQRQRRRAKEKLWAIQKVLADRQVSLVSYDHVIADMVRRRQDGLLSPFGYAQSVFIVTALRDATKSECSKLADDVTALEIACKQLEPEASTSDPKEIMLP